MDPLVYQYLVGGSIFGIGSVYAWRQGYFGTEGSGLRNMLIAIGGFLFFLRLLALAALIVAMARPQIGKGHSEVEASGIDIVLTIDLSDSMLADDIPPSRLDLSKVVLRDFVGNRPNDRIGLIAFSGKAYIASPLTLDHKYLRSNLKRLTIDTFNRGDEEGTAIGSGIMAAINRLVELKKSKIRGVESNGMMCSVRELELGEEHDGIIELSGDAPVGASFAEYHAASPIIDVAITPDRPDCMGVMGIARDLAAAGAGSCE